jgi:hypothetical protein
MIDFKYQNFTGPLGYKYCKSDATRIVFDSPHSQKIYNLVIETIGKRIHMVTLILSQDEELMKKIFSSLLVDNKEKFTSDFLLPIKARCVIMDKTNPKYEKLNNLIGQLSYLAKYRHSDDEFISHTFAALKMSKNDQNKMKEFCKIVLCDMLDSALDLLLKKKLHDKRAL